MRLLQKAQRWWLACASAPAVSFASSRATSCATRLTRSLIWQLAQVRPMLESEALERIEEKLERLGGGQVTRLYDGRSDDDHPLISAH